MSQSHVVEPSIKDFPAPYSLLSSLHTLNLQSYLHRNTCAPITAGEFARVGVAARKVELAHAPPTASTSPNAMTQRRRQRLVPVLIPGCVWAAAKTGELASLHGKLAQHLAAEEARVKALTANKVDLVLATLVIVLQLTRLFSISNASNSTALLLLQVIL